MNATANWGPRANAYFKAADAKQAQQLLRSANTPQEVRSVIRPLWSHANELSSLSTQDGVTLSPEARKHLDR